MLGEQEEWLASVSGKNGRNLAHRVAKLDAELDERFRNRSAWKEARPYLAHAAYEAVVADLTPPGGIYGVGVSAIDSGGQYLAPAVFVVPDLVGASTMGRAFDTIPVWNTSLADLLEEYDVSVPKDLVIVTLPMPEEQIAAGGPVECNSVQGTRGVQVWTADDHVAITTAGHVGDPTGSTVTSDGAPIGVVGFTDRLSRHSSGELVADIAIVQTYEGVPLGGGPQIVSVGVAKQLVGVVAYGRSGPQQGWIRSAMSSFALRPDAGMWGSVLLTDRAISSNGDSGAPVLLDDDSGTVIGHVVAGAPPAYSLIQDVTFALRQAGATLA